MAITGTDIGDMLNELGITFEAVDENMFLLGFETMPYMNLNHQFNAVVVIRLEEHGELVRVEVPQAFLADGRNKHAVLETCMQIHDQIKWVRFSYDQETGRLTPQIHILLGETFLTLPVLRRAIYSLLATINRYFRVFSGAAQFGIIDFSVVLNGPNAETATIGNSTVPVTLISLAKRRARDQN